jgi:hypothetical protein
MDERYERVWNELGEQPASEDGPALPDLFYRAVDGLEPLDYHWMLQAAVVRDGVSAFAVYLEKVGAEVLRRHGYTWAVQLGRTPVWVRRLEVRDLRRGADAVHPHEGFDRADG